MKRLHLLTLAAVLAFVAWFLYSMFRPAALTRLNAANFHTLKDEFNRAQDGARLLVLLSPT